MTQDKDEILPCRICDNSGWVCEEHPDKPFEHYTRLKGFSLDPRSRCTGAGMPCKCNTYNPPWNYPDKTRTEVTHDKTKE